MLTPLPGSLYWFLLKIRRKFRHLCLGKGAFHSLALALRPHLSLPYQSGKAGLCCPMNPNTQWLTPQKVIFCQCYVPTVGLQGSSVHCGHSRTPVGKGFCLTHVSFTTFLLPWLRGEKVGNHSPALRASTWK